jgi:ubiquinone/menaquinone biosynthesis C-methylase UbiE
MIEDATISIVSETKMPHDDYHRIAWGYDFLIEPFNRSLRSVAFRVFRPEAGADILDVACGTGTQLAFYRDQGFHPAGIDLSAAMLAVARKRLDRRTMISRGDAASMPWRRRTFDWALASFVLHEMAPGTRSEVLLDMTRILKKTGRLGIVDYHPERAPTLKGWVSRAVIRGIEFAAGRRHYANYRHFVAAGGIPTLADRHGLTIERQKRVSGGNIGIYQLCQAR